MSSNLCWAQVAKNLRLRWGFFKLINDFSCMVSKTIGLKQPYLFSSQWLRSHKLYHSNVIFNSLTDNNMAALIAIENWLRLLCRKYFLPVQNAIGYFPSQNSHLVDKWRPSNVFTNWFLRSASEPSSWSSRASRTSSGRTGSIGRRATASSGSTKTCRSTSSTSSGTATAQPRVK